MDSFSYNNPKSSVNILLCSPSFNRSVDLGFMQSVLNLCMDCVQTGISITFYTPYNSLIAIARNSCIDTFMKGEYTHLLFIDTDESFETEQVIRLLQSDFPLVGAFVPLKKYNIDKLVNTGTDSEKYQSMLKYNFGITKDKDEKTNNTNVDIKNEFVNVIKIGTGFMMLKRDVIEKMEKEYPEYISENDEKIKDYFLFQTVVENKVFIGEDFFFCKLWKKMGGEIWADTKSKVNHIGTHTFTGDTSYHFHADEFKKDS
jgi:hypothetical protein